MKNILILLVFSSLTVSGYAKTKKSSPPPRTTPNYSASIQNDHKWNVSFSPVAVLVGILNVELDYSFMPKWAFGIDFSYLSWKVGDVELTGSSILFEGKYYFYQAFEDGWFASGGMGTNSIKATETSVAGVQNSAEASGAYFQAGGGYHWFWRSFNQQLGAYLVKYSYNSIDIKDGSGRKVDSYTPASLTIDYKIGWAF